VEKRKIVLQHEQYEPVPRRNIRENAEQSKKVLRDASLAALDHRSGDSDAHVLED
jgi:hypothetical protein